MRAIPGAEHAVQHVLEMQGRLHDGMHALIAYNAAGRDEHQRRVLAKLEKSANGVHTNATVTRELALLLARALASERTEQKPTSPFNWELTARALDVAGNATAAMPVREHAALRRRAQFCRSAA